ncbi:MAG: hypothetical protein CR982_02805 [Candidatus Cloacimonadota bacterium]|nr:MAG: hypothetical protein CR982_02805 [Candidatus Cloacimonadota bacterium]PIE79199.1 MAG: hypothetical protein CSA15_04000 [Candidatus Delongbacteria bacterium]
MSGKENQIRLLPNYFYKVATSILIVSILAPIVVHNLIVELDKKLIFSIVLSGVMLSLVIFAFTKNKEEDELTLKIRVESFAGAFIAGLVFILFDNIFGLVKSEVVSNISTHNILFFNMLSFYFIFYYLKMINR